jgi:hypothetical protein
MPEPVTLLMLEFLAWVSNRVRTHAEAMEAWRSSCPRHTVWEDALVDGLIQVEGGPLREAEVSLTPRGRAILDENHSPKSTRTPPAPDV